MEVGDNELGSELIKPALTTRPGAGGETIFMRAENQPYIHVTTGPGMQYLNLHLDFHIICLRSMHFGWLLCCVDFAFPYIPYMREIGKTSLSVPAVACNVAIVA